MARRPLQRTQRSIPPRFRGNSRSSSSRSSPARSSQGRSPEHSKSHPDHSGEHSPNRPTNHPTGGFPTSAPPRGKQQRGNAPQSQKAAPRTTPAHKTVASKPPQTPIPSNDAHTVFAAFDNERLYLANTEFSVENNAQDVFAEFRYEQALMRHLGALDVPPVMWETSEETEEVSHDAAHETKNVEASTNAPSAALAPRRTPPRTVEENEELRSPFGDVISSVEEILQAKHGGRYMPSSRGERTERDGAERERPKTAQERHLRRLALHPATTLRYYTPPHKSVVENERKHHRYQNRTKSEFPAAVPKEGIFEVMPAETRPFYERVQNYLRNDALLPHGATLIAAVSGGVDSISMLDMLAKLREAHKYKIFVLHFNHRLRGRESDQDEYFVRETAKRYGFPCYVAAADVGLVSRTERISIEHAARELRYNALEFLSRKLTADAVCTAHTVNDSVETLLLNLLRGSGLAGLAGIPSERPFEALGKVIRPLLGMKKADVVRYAGLRKLSWREDASNELTMFTRNKIRLDLLPKLENEYSPNIVEVLHRTAHILSGADDLVRETVERLSKYVLTQEEQQPYIGVRVSALRLQTPFLQSEILRRAMQKRFHVSLSFDAVERILSLSHAETGAKADITRNYFAVRDRDMILLSERIAVTDLNVRVEKNNRYDFGGWRIFLDEIERKNVKFTSDPAVEFFDSDMLPYRMTLRRWQAGDVFTPLGMKGTMNVSDFLTNSKISFFNRQHVLALTAAQADGEKLVWLCGLRLNDEFKVHPETRRVLRVEFRRPKFLVPQAHDDSDEV